MNFTRFAPSSASLRFVDLPVELRYHIYTYLNIVDLRNILRTSLLEQQVAKHIFTKLTTIESFLKFNGQHKLVPYLLTKNKLIGPVRVFDDKYFNDVADKFDIVIVILEKSTVTTWVDIFYGSKKSRRMLRYYDSFINESGAIITKLSELIPQNNYLLYSHN